ncbi:MAG: FecR domain-containing protein [Armatimonadetes bacterium]|nr:FecR domain-containing protein [Armatimonadota bacterium]
MSASAFCSLARIRTLLMAAALLLGISSSGFCARPEVNPVATMDLTDGTVGVRRPGTPTWYAGFNGMSLYVGDRIGTDKNSRAIVRFSIGRIGLAKGTVLALVGSAGTKKLEAPNALRYVRVLKGAIWVKFDKKHEPFYFRAKQSLVCIKDTELVVEDTVEDGTRVDVLEGEVTCTPCKDNASEAAVEAAQKADTQPISAGTTVSLNDEAVPTVHREGADELRKDAEQRYPGLREGVVREILGVAARYIPYGDLGLKIIDNPNKAAADIVEQEVSRRTGIDAAGALSRIITGDDPGKPNFPAELSPNMTQANPDDLVFSWKDYKNRPEFSVMLSQDEQMRTLDWTGKVKGTQMRFPKDALPLQPGTRYIGGWLIISMGRKS